MKRSIRVLGAVSLFSLAAAAQDVPRVEVFAGYTYMRINSSNDVPAFSANGGGGQLVINLARWLGLATDFGAVHNGNIGGYHLDSTFYNFMLGPRFPIRVSNRVTPYFQALFGGVYAATSVEVVVPPGTVIIPPVIQPLNTATPIANVPDSASLRATANQAQFAYALGGGLDVKVNKWVSIRPIGLDYFEMRLENLRVPSDNKQRCLRYTAGVNFTIGAR